MKRRPWQKLALRPMMWASGVLTVVVTGVLTLFAQQQIVNPAARPPALRLLAPETASSDSLATALSGSGGQDDSESPAESSEDVAESRGSGDGGVEKSKTSDGQAESEIIRVRPASGSEEFEIRLVFQKDESGDLRLMDIRLIGAAMESVNGEGVRSSEGDVVLRVGVDPAPDE